ncbi:MAG TPA: efflux RND transporter periplasmic adaptor subunit, partial [Polyangiaceae bacterium]|nr:efflux RND transporter periplasmic adaptor subunit [Polyangiaceae bacterium]
MTRRAAWSWSIVVVSAVVLFGAAWHYYRKHRPPPVTYQTAEVTRRRVVGKVTATGTLLATVTVQVGSQVSGNIQKLLADYNSTVKKGQLIAKINPLIFEAAVEQAKANYASAKAALVSARAQADLAGKQLAREQALEKDNLAAKQDVDTAQSNADVTTAQVQVATAALAQSEAQLHQAETNLSFTNIVSPIDGTVISRSVDVGQTVAASLQAPTLFTIAEDLRKMQVNTNVSEGDVGRVEEGMAATFTVDAFPGQRFRGRVSQIRNAATTVQNVVTYDAVIDVDNSDLRLRPGMTANVTIVYADHRDVLAVPNAALRFRPPPEANVQARTRAPSDRRRGGEGAESGSASSGSDGSGTSGGAPRAPGAASGWGAGGGWASDGAGGDARRGAGAGGWASDGAGGDARRGGAGGGWASGGGNGGWTSGGAAGGGGSGGEGRHGHDGGAADSRTVWKLAGGEPVALVVTAGLSDGAFTEIVGGDAQEDDAIIVDATVTGKA